MFASRQYEEMQPLLEVSRTAGVSPGAITTGATVNVAAAACTVGFTTSPATFALGDQLEVFAPASAALNGVQVSAAASATPGTCTLSFTNPTGGTITPVAASVYTIVATRLMPNLV